MEDKTSGKTCIDLVVFDLAGTTVDDSVDGLPLVTVAMKEAFQSRGIIITPDQVNQVRGMEKKEAIKNLLDLCVSKEITGEHDSTSSNEMTVDMIFRDFKKSLNSHLNEIDKEIPGTTTTFLWLRSKGIKVAVGSGFPHSVVMSLVGNLGWNDIVHFTSSAEQEGHGRPNPALIYSAMRHCGVTDKGKVLKVGDTVVDIEEGKNAGCMTIAVLTGTQSEAKLKTSNPDFIIKSIADLPELIQIRL